MLDRALQVQILQVIRSTLVTDFSLFMIDRRILGNHLGLRFLVFALEKLVTARIYGLIYGLELLVTKIRAMNYLGHLVVDFGILG